MVDFTDLFVLLHDGSLIRQQSICHPVKHSYPLLCGQGLQLARRIACLLCELTSFRHCVAVAFVLHHALVDVYKGKIDQPAQVVQEESSLCHAVTIAERQKDKSRSVEPLLVISNQGPYQ